MVSGLHSKQECLLSAQGGSIAVLRVGFADEDPEAKKMMQTRYHYCYVACSCRKWSENEAHA